MATALIYFDGTNVMLIRESDVPTPPNTCVTNCYQSVDCECTEAKLLYNNILEAAKKKAIKVENATRVGNHYFFGDHSIELHRNEPFSLPSGYTYEVQQDKAWCELSPQNKCISPDCECGNLPVTAIIKPIVVLPEEGEDELWEKAEAIVTGCVGRNNTEAELQAYKVINALKSQFKLTRR